MIAQREVWEYAGQVKVWVGKYRNSHNMVHWHSDCELLYVEHGNIDIFCGGETHTLMDGELLYADSGQVHSMQARDPETVLIVIIFDYDILKPYVGDLCPLSPKLEGSYPIPEVYEELREVLLSQKPFFGGEAAGIVISLMSRIYRGEKLGPRKTTDETTRRFTQLLGEVSEKIQYYCFRDAAAFMGMSEAYFSRYFHKVAGIPFSSYLSYVRTMRAIGLIRTHKELSMTEIADLCGFGTIRNFNRIFKRITGYTPTTLPDVFEPEEGPIYTLDIAFDPTLHDCELIESSGRTGQAKRTGTAE